MLPSDHPHRYNPPIAYGHPNYPDKRTLDGSGRPRDPAKQPLAYEYNASKIKHDSSVSYRSEKYPWLEAVHKYAILSHQPHDYDRISLQVPGFHGPGHYVAYFYWRGYANCVDINLHPDPVPEEEIYGVIMEEPEWGKIDHCQFTDFDLSSN